MAWAAWGRRALGLSLMLSGLRLCAAQVSCVRVCWAPYFSSSFLSADQPDHRGGKLWGKNENTPFPKHVTGKVGGGEAVLGVRSHGAPSGLLGQLPCSLKRL